MAIYIEYIFGGDELIVINYEKVIRVDIKDDRYKEIIIDSSIDLEYSTNILCGNYVYWYVYSSGKGIELLNGRYNLLTDEYEDFDWEKLKGGKS